MGSIAYSQNKMIKDVDTVQPRTCLTTCSDFFWLNNLLISYHTQHTLLFQISSKRCLFTSSGTTSMRPPSEPEPLSHLPSLPPSFIYMINPPGGQHDKPQPTVRSTTSTSVQPPQPTLTHNVVQSKLSNDTNLWKWLCRRIVCFLPGAFARLSHAAVSSSLALSAELCTRCFARTPELSSGGLQRGPWRQLSTWFCLKKSASPSLC